MALILKRPWTSQPQVAVPLNPAYGLRALLLPSLGWDVARVAAPFAVTGTPSRAPVGRGIAYVTSDGSLIDALNNSSTSTSSATVVISGRYVGAAPSANSYGQFGAQAVASAERFGAHIPFTDGTVYFDFGGSTTGTNRVIAAGLTFSQADTWVFSTGPAGMQIWQNGILRASNTANPSRTNAGGGNFGLRGNSSGGTSGDSGQWALFGYAPVQWSKDQNAAISANPWQLFAPLPRRIWAPGVAGAPFKPAWAIGSNAVIGAGVMV